MRTEQLLRRQLGFHLFSYAVPHTVLPFLLSHPCSLIKAAPLPARPALPALPALSARPARPVQVTLEEAGHETRKSGADTGTDIGFWGGPLALFLLQDIGKWPGDLWGGRVLCPNPALFFALTSISMCIPASGAVPGCGGSSTMVAE